MLSGALAELRVGDGGHQLIKAAAKLDQVLGSAASAKEG